MHLATTPPASKPCGWRLRAQEGVLRKGGRLCAGCADRPSNLQRQIGTTPEVATTGPCRGAKRTLGLGVPFELTGADATGRSGRAPGPNGPLLASSLQGTDLSCLPSSIRTDFDDTVRHCYHHSPRHAALRRPSALPCPRPPLPATATVLVRHSVRRRGGGGPAARR